jgi:hypothetical protein
MKKLIKVFLSIVIVVMLVAVIQKLRFTNTNTTTDYWYEEMDLLFLYYIK